MKRAVNVEYLKLSQVLVPLGFLWQNLFDLGGMSKNLFFEMFSGKSLPVPPIEGFSWLNFDSIFSFLNSEMGRTVEIPSINVNCSARGIWILFLQEIWSNIYFLGLAVIGASMANRGKFKGIQVYPLDKIDLHLLRIILGFIWEGLVCSTQWSNCEELVWEDTN